MKILKIIKKIIHFKLSIIIIFILPITIFTLLTSKTTVIQNIRSYVVLTGSMSPTIPQGSIIYTKNASNYEKGDVIAFKTKEGQVVTHRIVEVQKNGYKTKGDANNSADKSLVSPKDILGGQIFSLPYAGKFILFLKTMPGFLLFIILPGTLFILFEIWNIKIHMEEEIQKKLVKQLQSA